MKWPRRSAGSMPLARCVRRKVRDDQGGIADRIGRKRRFVTPGHGGGEAFRCLPHGERKRVLLLNATQLRHRIRLPRRLTATDRPGFGGSSHGPPRTDARLPFVPLIPGLLRRREFLSDA